MSDFEKRLGDALSAGAEDAPGSAVGLAVTSEGGPVSSQTSTAADPDEPEPQPPEDAFAHAPEVTCGGEASWPVSTMNGDRTGDVDDAEVRAAFADLLREAPLDAPRPIAREGPENVEWILLDDDPLVLGVGEWSAAGGAGQTAQSIGLDRTDTGLHVTSWGYCQLSVALLEGRAQVEVTQARLDPATGEVVVSVNERACTSARDPSAFLGEPTLVEGADRVLVFVTSQRLEATATCPGNPSVDLTLDLAEPLGDRTVYDAGVWPFKPVPVR